MLMQCFGMLTLASGYGNSNSGDQTRKIEDVNVSIPIWRALLLKTEKYHFYSPEKGIFFGCVVAAEGPSIAQVQTILTWEQPTTVTKV